MEVLVEHDYTAKEPNELSIIKGDIIRDVIKKQGGWWEGTLKDKKGLFPDNFVKILDRDTSVVMRNRKDVSRIRQCRVVFSYKQDHEDELNLNVGDVIDILGEEEEGWWRGLLNGKEGVFPSNFVEEIAPKSSNRESLTNSTKNEKNSHSGHHNKSSKLVCEVKFPYKAQNEDELSLMEGDIITLVSKDGQDPGWWKGELHGVVGVFPDNFVTLIPEDKHILKEDKKHNKTHIESPAKPAALNPQRKSLVENNNGENRESENAPSQKSIPPIPSKKPSIPIKKSPSGSGSGGGIFFGLKKKLVDVVDGATGSKTISPPKGESVSSDVIGEYVFDNVVRRPLLSDVRASRPKAPGRRLPSGVYKESDLEMMNGNGEQPAEYSQPAPSSSPETDTTDNKPKLREWEKHKAPWLEEMKLNQAKRTSTSPGPETKPRNSVELEDKAAKSSDKESVKESSSPVDIPKKRTPPQETPVLRSRPTAPRPQTIQSTGISSDSPLQKPPVATYPKVSPLNHKTPSPLKHEKGGDSEPDGVSNRHLDELVQRVGRLEELLEQQKQSHEAAMEELKGKLQIETEMRMELQARFENLVADSAVQQI